MFLFMWAIQTAEQLSYWRDNVKLWVHTIEACGESTVADENLASAYMEQGRHERESGRSREAQRRFEQAGGHYRKALDTDPRNMRAGEGLGVALSNQGKLKEAVQAYREAVRMNPNWARAHYHLAAALADLGQSDEAMTECELALQCDPRWALAHKKLGELLLAK